MSVGLSIFLCWFSGLVLFTFGYVFIKRVIDKDIVHDTLAYDIYILGVNSVYFHGLLLYVYYLFGYQ